MSENPVRDALQAHLELLSPALRTAWENVEFKPRVGENYQRADLVNAEPENTEISRSFIERGFLQVRLCFEAGKGPAPLDARWKALRLHFYRGLSLPPVAGVVTTIERTPGLGPAIPEPDRYCRPVRIRFYAHQQA